MPTDRHSRYSNAEPTLGVNSLRVVRHGRLLLEVEALSASSGEFIAVIGPNGAGKSTLLRAVTGEWPSDGQIAVLGRTLGDRSRPVLARRLAVMAQSTSLGFDFTVEEVVGLGRLPHRGEGRLAHASAVAQALDALALEPFAARKYTTLSGGERQRVQFARVLAQLAGNTEPSLLLLDEPTSALDLAQQKLVLDLAWQQARKGTTVIAVLHDLNHAAAYADRLWVFAQGRLVRAAVPVDVLTPEFVEAVYGVKVSVGTMGKDPRLLVRIQPQYVAAAGCFREDPEGRMAG